MTQTPHSDLFLFLAFEVEDGPLSGVHGDQLAHPASSSDQVESGLSAMEGGAPSLCIFPAFCHQLSALSLNGREGEQFMRMDEIAKLAQKKNSMAAKGNNFQGVGG